MGRFDKYMDSEAAKENYVPVRKKRQADSEKKIDKLVSVKIYQSVQKRLKEVSFQTNKSQTLLISELVERFLPMIEQELLRENENVSKGQTSIYDYLD